MKAVNNQLVGIEKLVHFLPEGAERDDVRKSQ